jgi:hypothetical protein
MFGCSMSADRNDPVRLRLARLLRETIQAHEESRDEEAANKWDELEKAIKAFPKVFGKVVSTRLGPSTGRREIIVNLLEIPGTDIPIVLRK